MEKRPRSKERELGGEDSNDHLLGKTPSLQTAKRTDYPGRKEEEVHYLCEKPGADSGAAQALESAEETRKNQGGRGRPTTPNNDETWCQDAAQRTALENRVHISHIYLEGSAKREIPSSTTYAAFEEIKARARKNSAIPFANRETSDITLYLRREEGRNSQDHLHLTRRCGENRRKHARKPRKRDKNLKGKKHNNVWGERAVTGNLRRPDEVKHRGKIWKEEDALDNLAAERSERKKQKEIGKEKKDEKKKFQ